MYENVSSMTPADSWTVTVAIQEGPIPKLPYAIEAGEIGPINRDRLYWTSWEMPSTVDKYDNAETGRIQVKFPPFQPLLSEFLNREHRK